MNFGRTNAVFGGGENNGIYGDTINQYRRSNYAGYSQKQRFSIIPFKTNNNDKNSSKGLDPIWRKNTSAKIPSPVSNIPGMHIE
jgi:hypothetical protein